MLQRAAQKGQGATVFGYHVTDPERFGVVEFDEQMQAVSIEEKPAAPKIQLCSNQAFIFMTTRWLRLPNKSLLRNVVS